MAARDRSTWLLVVAFAAAAAGCAGREAAPATSAGDAGADSPSCIVLASNYDQSCDADTDCWVVNQAASCDPCSVGTWQPINNAALLRYYADSAKARPLVFDEAGHSPCGSPPTGIMAPQQLSFKVRARRISFYRIAPRALMPVESA